ncbi:MAG: hypothetical protein R3B48_10075 [Kofleriaceae bacterium]
MTPAAEPVRGALAALVSTWRGRAIAAYLAAQLLLPLGYYARRDRHDERFSWRMFSTMRMATCEPEFRRDGRPVALTSEFHVAWIELAKRGRRAVVVAMGQHLCAAHPGQAVVVNLRCRYLDGSSREAGGFDLCKLPEL